MLQKTLMVVDSNFLRSPKLRDYLRERETNCVVLTDYAAMEAFKRDPLVTLRHSMQIISDYPAQAIVLKFTTAICGLAGDNQADLCRQMIDAGQTREFPAWCTALRKAARPGNQAFVQHVSELGVTQTPI